MKTKLQMLFSVVFVICLIGASERAWGQTTVFTDDFSTNTDVTYTTSGAIGSSAWSVNRSGDDWGARRNTSPAQLELTNDVGATANVNGWIFTNTAMSSFSSPFSTTLSSNPGLVTWYFNIRQIRTDPAGYASGSYGAAFILATTSQTANNTGTGYAIVYGQSGSTDPVRLARFSGGLSTGLTNIITSNTTGLTDFGAEYLSVKITYNPSTDEWELFLRNDGASAFTDPTSGTLTSQGTAIDNTYTGTSLSYMGGYWQGSTGATQTAFFDNVSVTATAGSVTAPSTQASEITFSSIGANQITVGWTNGDGSKRVVIMNTTNSFTDPTDGTDPTANSVYGGSGEQVIYNNSSNTVTVTGLTASTTYYYRVYEYNGSGSSTKYITTTATNNPNSQATSEATSSASNIITSNNETSNIDYASYQAASISSTSEAVRVWSFTIQDGGGSADGDAFGTELTDITIGKSAGNSVSSWASRIRQAALFDGSTLIAQISVSVEMLNFSGMSGLNVTASDNGSKTLDLYLTFETLATDNNQYGFQITSATANIAKSQFAASDAGGATSSVSGDANRVEVTATKLAYATNKPPSNVYINAPINVQVVAKDANDNLDLDATPSVTLSRTTGTGTLSSSTGLTQSLSAGMYSWSDVTYNTVESFVITASASLLTSAVSGSISCQNVPVANHVVIAEVYGGGGNTGAPYTNDYIVLYNPTGSSVDLSGWSVQYASATSTSATWSVTALSGSILANSYYLIQEASGGAVGAAIPVPARVTGSINMGASAGKLVLANTTTAFAVQIPSGATVIDLVGFGTTANGYEGTGPTSAPSNSSSARRKSNSGTNVYGSGNGCDSDDNSADFYIETDLITNAPLPVEMTSFTASMQNATIAILHWHTATEQDNLGFEVERRAENTTAWTKVGYVAGSGTSNSPKDYTYQDVNLAPGVYVYRLKQIDIDGNFKYVATTQVDAGLSKGFELLSNYPNPFNPETNIRFSVPENGFATLKVFNMLGQEVATLFSGIAQAGHYIPATFDAGRLSSGVYFSRLEYNGKSIVQRMVLTK